MNNKLKVVRLCMSKLPLFILLLFVSRAAIAQDPVPVDASGNSIVLDDSVDASRGDGAVIRYGAINAQLPVFTSSELEQFVGPIALYPDNLLAIILPASTYPLQIVLAARFLEQLEADSSLKPDESWDESVIALLNYPEVIQMMNADIQWTWQLGEAVVSQEADVLTAINSFREVAYDAGNLKSDAFQEVTSSDETIVITQASETVVYVPYYVPEEVVVYQPEPVYHYYPTAYPVYYYPYAAGHHFRSDYFWGVTTVFSIGWSDHHLHVYHHSYDRHPYFGRSYYAGHHYRRPSITAFNRAYVDYGYRNSRDRTRGGSYWRPQRNSGARPNNRRINDRIYSASDARSVSIGNSGDRGRNRRGSRGDNDNRLGNAGASRGGNRVGNRIGNRGDSRGLNTNRATTSIISDRSTGVSQQSPRRRGNRRGSDSAAAPLASAFANTTPSVLNAPALIEEGDGAENRVRGRTGSRTGSRTDSRTGSRTGSRADRAVAGDRPSRGRARNRVSNLNGASIARAVARTTPTRQATPTVNTRRQPAAIAQTAPTNRVTNRTSRRLTTVNRSQRATPAERRSRVIGQTSGRQRAAPQPRRTETARTARRSSAPAATRSSRPSSQNARSSSATRSAPTPRRQAQRNRRSNRGTVREP